MASFYVLIESTFKVLVNNLSHVWTSHRDRQEEREREREGEIEREKTRMW